MLSLPVRLCASLLLAAVCWAAASFTNPLLPFGPDPWVIYHDGFFYYMNTMGTNLTIWKTRDITDLRNAERKEVWQPPVTGPNSAQVWAPELHYLEGRWYIYFAADEGTNATHRLWVIENSAADPLAGTWTLKGELKDPTDDWAIDPTVFEHRGKLYVVWSGWPGKANGIQNLYLAVLKNPWTIGGQRVLLSSPQYHWEKIGNLPHHRHVNVNEGPEFLEHGKEMFIVYSASGCWTDHYTLGMLSASADSDPLDASSWKKYPKPVFSESAKAHAFGPGHNAFFKSPDGTQDWIIYHANPEPHEGCDNHRSPRAQPFTWKPDGLPDFGKPVPTGTPISKPSGTP